MLLGYQSAGTGISIIECPLPGSKPIHIPLLRADNLRLKTRYTHETTTSRVFLVSGYPVIQV